MKANVGTQFKETGIESCCCTSIMCYIGLNRNFRVDIINGVCVSDVNHTLAGKAGDEGTKTSSGEYKLLDSMRLLESERSLA